MEGWMDGGREGMGDERGREGWSAGRGNWE